MIELTKINDIESAWQPLTSSKLDYSIHWNSKTGEVKVAWGRFIIIGPAKARNANVAQGIGEDLLSQNNCKIKREEFNARIPIINLG